MTCIILLLMNLIPGLSLRVSADDEEMGLDDTQLGEFAYDYVELTRHVGGVLTNGEEPSKGSGDGAEKV